MTGLINGWFEADINEDQTQILFDGDWYDILEDQDGQRYFMYSGKSFYFTSHN